MNKSLSICLQILLPIVFLGCSQEFPAIAVKEVKDARWTEKKLIIYKNGEVLKEVINKITSPPELQFELNSMVDFDIDSTKRIIFVNNFAKELLAISIDNGQILHRACLKQAYYYPEGSHNKLKGKVFHVKKYKDKVLLITNMGVLTYNEELQLEKKLLDSVALKNPRLLKGFTGAFDYSLEGDTVTLIYRIEDYAYGLDDSDKDFVIEEYSFKL